MTVATKQNLLHELAILAETHIRFHREVYDGEKCFNLFTFLAEMEHVLFEKLESRCSGFRLDPSEAARLVWCHLCLTTNDDPAGDTFRGMPILD